MALLEGFAKKFWGKIFRNSRDNWSGEQGVFLNEEFQFFSVKSTQTSHGKIDNTPITDEPIFSLAPYFLCNFFGLK